MTDTKLWRRPPPDGFVPRADDWRLADPGPHAAGDADMTEKMLSGNIRKQSAELGVVHRGRFRWYHTWRSKRSDVGFPDEVCVGAGGIGFFELKMHGGVPTLPQIDWIRAIADLDRPFIIARVIYPAHFSDGTMLRYLRVLAGLGELEQPGGLLPAVLNRPRSRRVQFRPRPEVQAMLDGTGPNPWAEAPTGTKVTP